MIAARRRLVPAAAVLLLVATFCAYLPVLRNEFVDYDDADYLTENVRLRDGLNWSNVRWALTAMEKENWFPLTWISHLADMQLHGLNPAGHHFTSLLFHLANTALLLLVLRRLTGDLRPALLCAALFALHPLHVESVAWAAERKDVLSAFFWLLTMAAYARYARAPTAARYGAVALGTALSLMAKPVAVTLPCALLLLDYWPLRRWPPPQGAASSALRLVLEKVPLLALSAGASFLTYLAQQRGGAVGEVVSNTPAVRLGRAFLADLRYLGKTFWPADLSVLYVYHEGQDSPAKIAAAAAVILLLTAGALLAGRRRGFLIVGWLWFLGVLVPMAGFVQVGSQSIADRYTYLPHVGLFIAFSWGLRDLARSRPALRRALAAAVCALLVLLGGLTFRQARLWRDTITLFTHAVATSPDNWIARFILGRALSRDLRIEESDAQLRAALRIFPRMPQAHLLLGLNQLFRQDPGAAARHFAAEIEISPRDATAHFYLGETLAGQGRWAEALPFLLRATALDTGLAAARAKAEEARRHLAVAPPR